MTKGRALKGLERERAMMSAAVCRITKAIFDIPLRKPQRNDRTGLLAPPPLKAFQRLEPIDFNINGDNDDEWWIFHPEDCTPDVVWPLSVGYVASGEHGHGRLMMTRSTTVSMKEVRGTVTRFSPYMVREDKAMHVAERELWTASAIHVWIGGKWTNADAHLHRYDNQIAPDDRGKYNRDNETPCFATALALRQRYEWAVSLALDADAPSIRFATDPTGIKELFRLRDAPEGKDRRDALLRWVESHWRQTRNDPDIELYVRKHLRGAVKFDWRGMMGEILPSQFDLDKRDQLIADREAMRLAGMDRRHRIGAGTGLVS